MKINIIVLVLAATTLMTACSPSVPKCNDDLVVTTVEVILKKQMGAVSAIFAGLIAGQDASMSFKIDTIRTMNTNGTTGAHECAANFSVTNSNAPAAPQSTPIKYKVETLDDTGEVYVSIIE